LRSDFGVFRGLVARSLALLLIGVVPIVAGAAIGTPAAFAASSGHDSTVYAFGNASFRGSTQGMALNAPIVGMAPTANGKGYWMVANDGGIFGFNAPFFGSLGAMHLNAPIVGMAATPTGKGYWLVAGDGGVFSFGDAHFYGSTGAMHLNAPVTQLVPGPNGRGYWLMATDGGVFTFGAARFAGSMGATHLNAPVIGMTSTPKGHGYLLVASDGGVFTFGDARFHGSTGSRHVGSPVVGLAGTSTGGGYWLATQNGNVFNFGDAQNEGNAVHTLAGTRQIIQITGVPGRSGYRLLAQAKPIFVAPPLGVGSSGAAVMLLQQRLLDLGFWLPGVTGSYDSLTQQAVYAFQKWSNLPRTGELDVFTRTKLNTAARPVPRSPSGYVIEIDKTRQVLIVASGGRASWIFNASSGSDHPYVSEGVGYSAHTPEGFFNIQRQVDGFDKSPLGELYRPKYFTNTGIAVHGYTDVPPYPASHGCVRVSNAAIDFMWNNNILPIGTAVWVYV
jgi:peptidoglycan hydrolase-like protein with peptidoglycan-binding domain